MDDYKSVSNDGVTSGSFVSPSSNKTKKDRVPLSSLTAKYNKTAKRHIHSGVNVDVTQKYSPTNATNSSSENESSDSEFSGSSLAALLVKHKGNTNTTNITLPNFNSNNSTSKLGTGLIYHSKSRNSSNESLSDIESSSLLSLMSKHHESNSASKKHASSSKSAECTSINDQHSNATKVDPSHKNLILKVASCKLKNDFGSKSDIEEVVSKFRKVSFSDSDSDESFSLSDLARKHTKSLSQDDSGSIDSIDYVKPKELLNVISTHRHHTKSESDSSPATLAALNILMKKGFDNQTSTSLDCLEDNSDFKFSLGCKLPASYKSIKVGNDFSSSLSSIKTSKININLNNSFSDSDVRKYKIENTSPLKSPSKIQNLFTSNNDSFSADSINLSSAIKFSSDTKINEELMQEDKDESLKELEREEIVTLLDTINVDEEIGDSGQVENERPYFNDELYEKCTFDASDILKVKLKLKTRKCSMFGKMVCKKWKALQTPYIKKERMIETTVIPFTFSTMSPDDQIWHCLERRNPQ